MKSKLNLRRGQFQWKRSNGHALANGIRPASWLSNPSQFAFSFGAYGWTKVRVWASADCFEDAFEAAVEWLDDNAPGHLVSNDEFTELCEEAAEELGFDPETEDEEELEEIRTAAEADLTLIGHTTLKHGQHIASYEWTADEITR